MLFIFNRWRYQMTRLTEQPNPSLMVVLSTIISGTIGLWYLVYTGILVPGTTGVSYYQGIIFVQGNPVCNVRNVYKYR
jgi:hypothetical protein